MMNLQLIQNQPRWRVAAVARFARLMGVCIHVEGIPFGSTRKRKSTVRTGVAGASGGAAIGGIAGASRQKIES